MRAELEIVATRAANEVLLHLVKLCLYAGFGLVTRESLAAGGVVAVAAAVAPLCARRILAGLDGRSFRRLGHAATCLAGMAMLASASTTLAAQHGVAVEGGVGRTSLRAALRWPDGAASVSWRRGHPPEFERTTSLSALPADARARVARLAEGAERIVCERVLRIGARGGYEISVYRDGMRIKLEV